MVFSRKRIMCIVLSVVFCLLTVNTVFAQKITIKLASPAPKRSLWDIEQNKLAQEWAKITNGQVSLVFYDTGAQGGEGAVIQKMRSIRPGQKSPLDGAIFSNVGLSMLAPQSYIFTLSVPFLLRDQAEADLALSIVGAQMEKTIFDQGYVVLGWFNVGWVTFFTKDKVTNIAELKKVKLAAGGADSTVLNNAFKAAGYNIESMPSDKVLQSLKSASGPTGFYSVPMYAYAMQYSKTINYVLDTAMSPVMSALVVSKSTWDAVPAQYKPAMIKAIKNTTDKFIINQKEIDESYLSKMEAEGVTRVKVSEAERAQWEADFAKDIESIVRGSGNAISLDMLSEIQAALAEYRSK